MTNLVCYAHQAAAAQPERVLAYGLTLPPVPDAGAVTSRTELLAMIMQALKEGEKLASRIGLTWYRAVVFTTKGEALTFDQITLESVVATVCVTPKGVPIVDMTAHELASRAGSAGGFNMTLLTADLHTAAFTLMGNCEGFSLGGKQMFFGTSDCSIVGRIPPDLRVPAATETGCGPGNSGGPRLWQRRKQSRQACGSGRQRSVARPSQAHWHCNGPRPSTGRNM